MFDDLPRLVTHIYQLGGRNPAFPHIGRLTKGLLGPRGLVFGDAETLGNENAALVMNPGASIHMRRGVPPEWLSMPVAREVARWYAMTCDEPIAIDELAAAILLPLPALRVYIDDFRYSAEEIAELLLLPIELVEHRIRVARSPAESGAYPSVRFAVA